MKKIRHWLAVVLAGVMMIILVGCGGTAAEPDPFDGVSDARHIFVADGKSAPSVVPATQEGYVVNLKDGRSRPFTIDTAVVLTMADSGFKFRKRVGGGEGGTFAGAPVHGTGTISYDFRPEEVGIDMGRLDLVCAEGCRVDGDRITW